MGDGDGTITEEEYELLLKLLGQEGGGSPSS